MDRIFFGRNRFGLPCVGSEGKRAGNEHQAAAEDVHRPLPALGLRLLSGLDTPEPAGRGLKLRLAAAALTAGADGEASRGNGRCADAAHRSERRGRRLSEHAHVL